MAQPDPQSNPFDAFDVFGSALPASDPGPPPRAPSSAAGSAASPTPQANPFDVFDGFAAALPAADAGPSPRTLASPASADSSDGFPFDLWGGAPDPDTPGAESAGDAPVLREDPKDMALLDADLDKSLNDRTTGATGAKGAGDTALEGIGWGGAHGPTAYRDEVNRKKQGGGGGGGGDGGGDGDPHPDLAPPPPLKAKGRRKSEILSVQAREAAPPRSKVVSPLPDCTLVAHSGHVLSRLSASAVRRRIWKQAFWIQHGPTRLLFFRSFADYESWLYNPYLTQSARNNLVKMRVDFAADVDRERVTGYQITEARKKTYGKSVMMHFKLERWTSDAGPTTLGAFAANQSELALGERTGSAVANDVAALRLIMVACLRRARANAAAGRKVAFAPGATKGDLKNVEPQRLVGMQMAKSKSGRRMSFV